MNQPVSDMVKVPVENLKAITHALSSSGRLDPVIAKHLKDAQQILWMSEDEIREWEIENYFKKCLEPKDQPVMLRPDYFKEENAKNNSTLRVMKKVWAFKDGVVEAKKEREEKKGKVLSNPQFSLFGDYLWWNITNISTTKWWKNNQNKLIYKRWLWRMLNLSDEEITKYSQERIDLKANQLLALSINHVTRYFASWKMKEWWILSKKFRSDAFSDIHTLWDKQKTFYDLVKLYIKYARKIKELKEAKIKNYPAIKKLVMAQFEIQRIFALTVLYNDREKNHVHQNLERDKAFLARIIWEITEIDEQKGNLSKVKWLNAVENDIYITTNIDWTYSISDEKLAGSEWPTTLNSTTLIWQIDFYDDRKTKVNIRHLEVRNIKDAQSAVDKVIMKWLSSFSQILDQKWIIIVIDDYKDANDVEMILSNMLWTWETSWAEPLEFDWQVNSQSGWDFVLKKWIIKVVYGTEAIKNRIKELENLLEKLENQIPENCSEDSNIKKAIHEINNLIDHFKQLAEKWALNLEIEVQIFDMQNYIKAEIDEKSPAFHWDYKDRQRTLEVFPKLFPIEIYWEESLRELLIPVVEWRIDTVKKLNKKSLPN